MAVHRIEVGERRTAVAAVDRMLEEEVHLEEVHKTVEEERRPAQVATSFC